MLEQVYPVLTGFGSQKISNGPTVSVNLCREAAGNRIRAKLILTWETRQTCWKLELFAAAHFFIVSAALSYERASSLAPHTVTASNIYIFKST